MKIAPRTNLSARRADTEKKARKMDLNRSTSADSGGNSKSVVEMTSKTLENKKGRGCQISLLKCARQACSHVFTSEEYKTIPRKWELGGIMMVCPKCNNDSMYTLWYDGTICNPCYHIDAHDIDPSSCLGEKMRREMIAAKRRALK